MDAAGDLAQLIDHAHEPCRYVRDLGTDPAALGGCRRRRTQPEGQRDEALLGAVVQVLLDPPTGLIGCRYDPRTGGDELGPVLCVGDRGGDEVGELRHLLLGAGAAAPHPIRW